MDVIIYSKELEPITVIELPLWMLEKLTKGPVKIPVVDKPTTITIKEAAQEHIKTITLSAIKVKYLKSETILLVTEDDELALTVTPSWLPGQRGAINDHKEAITTLTRAIKKYISKQPPESKQ